jgi:hypothetical protein
MAVLTVSGMLITNVYAEPVGVRMGICEVKQVELLLKDHPNPGPGWTIDEETGVATGPLTLGTEISALMTADMAEELADKLKDGARLWREVQDT